MDVGLRTEGGWVPSFACRDWGKRKAAPAVKQQLCSEAILRTSGFHTASPLSPLWGQEALVPMAPPQGGGHRARLMDSAMVKSIKMETWRKSVKKRETKYYWFSYVLQQTQGSHNVLRP